MAKNSFVMYHNYRETLEDLTDEQVGKLFRALFDYEIDKTEPNFTGELKIAFKFIKNDLDINMNKYENICERNRKNGQKGGAPKGNQNAKKQPKQPKQPDNDNDNDNDYEYDNDNKKEIKKEENKKGTNTLASSVSTNRTLSMVKEFFDNENIVIAVGKWLKHKQEKGQSYKAMGFKTLLNSLKKQLEEFGEQYVIDEIEWSISQNYSGIFPPKEQKSKPAEQKLSQYSESDLERYRR